MTCGFCSKVEYFESKISDFGPLNIINWKQFLTNSKVLFFEKWREGLNKSVVVKGASLKDYEKLKIIGLGSFGKVYLVENKNTKAIFAMKAISKETIVKSHQVEHTITEKLVLLCINCPFTIRLEQFFKDNSYIYFIVPFVQGGQLFYHLKQNGKFDELSAMFYVAQVIVAIEYLHFMDIVYRDLKPENILIDQTGYLKLADFGFCKFLRFGRTYSLCGTPEYLAPELIRGKGYGKAVDWWGVGILIYELTTGFTPFKEDEDIKMFKKVLNEQYIMPIHFSAGLKDLVRNILQADTSKRYGNLKRGVNDIKDHPWFRPLNWRALINRKLKPPFVPFLESSIDTRYFRTYNYNSLDISLNDMYTDEFKDF